MHAPVHDVISCLGAVSIRKGPDMRGEEFGNHQLAPLAGKGLGVHVLHPLTRVLDRWVDAFADECRAASVKDFTYMREKTTS